MHLKNNYFFTIRENIKDEDLAGGELLVRAGYVKKLSSGVYMLLPLGRKIMDKIENIIREEMNATGCLEVSMPSIIPEEVYIESGRRDNFGPSMFTLQDRFNHNFVLGPTHEELFAMAAKMKIKSYKDLPFSLYQFQTKFRDEPRPRYGLIRVREFVMKDSYTFDRDLEGLEVSYARQFQAYKNIFDRLELDYVIVRADTGVMGGLLSEEFQAISEIGEDTLVIEESSGYASNIEVAKNILSGEKSTEEHRKIEKVHTPNSRTIEEVSAFLKQDVKSFVKNMIYMVDGEPHLILVRGDHEINEVKVLKLLGKKAMELASPETVMEITGAPVGFAGPIGLKKQVPIIMDQEITLLANFTVGANEEDYHLINVNTEDFKADYIADVRNIKEGDLCENGRGRVKFTKGIEVGNTFKLGDKYSKALDLYYVNDKNERVPVIMGSYGIGLGRCIAALAEQKSTEKGLVWPKAIAPVQVAIIQISSKDQEQVRISEEIYESLKKTGLDVVLDDRDERPGVKFNDMELIGAHMRITVGKSIKDGKVEVKIGQAEKAYLVEISEIESAVREEFKEILK